MRSIDSSLLDSYQYQTQNYLSQEDIKQVVDMIKRQKSLRTFDIWTILPFLTPFKMCKFSKKKANYHINQPNNFQDFINGESAARKPLLATSSTKSDDKEQGIQSTDAGDVQRQERVLLGSNEDPYEQLFIRYGMGINSFFSLIRRLISVFYILMPIAILQMAILYSVNKDNLDQGFLGKISIAGFKYTKPVCKIVPANIQRVNLICPSGMYIQKVFDVGFHPYFIDEPQNAYAQQYQTACLGSKYRADQAYEFDERFACDRAIQTFIKEHGGRFYEEWLNKQGDSHDLVKHLYKDSECVKKGLWKKQEIFIQAACGTNDKDTSDTQIVGLLLACLSIMGTYVFHYFMDSYLTRFIQINNEGVLMRISSASQYTLQIQILPKQFKKFLNSPECFDKTCSQSGIAQQFERTLVNQIQRILKIELEDIQELNDDLEDDHFKIELCRFHFDNQNLLNYLQKRAELIKNPTKQAEVDALNLSLQEEKEGEKLNTFIEKNLCPHRAFVTFKWEDGAEDAENCLQKLATLKNSNKPELQEQIELMDFYGEPITLLERCEPSDIIWTNKKVQGWKMCKLLFGILSISIVCGLLVFALIFMLKSKSYQLKSIFPNTDSCKSLSEDFQNNPEFYKSYIQKNFEKHKSEIKHLNINVLSTSFFTSKNQYFKSDMICYCYTQTIDESTKDMCNLFKELKDKSNKSSIFIGLVIAVANFIFRTMLIYFSSLLQPETETKETNQVKTAVFIATFSNSGLLILLMSAYSRAPFFKHIFKGNYADFSPEWINDLGSIIVSSVVFNALNPLIDICIKYVIDSLSKMRDQNIWNPRKLKEFPTETKCNSVSKYYNLYAGPSYMIHYKLAAIQNILAVTFMFGTGMPILFPICYFALFILFYAERFTIAKLYRQPPVYGLNISLETAAEIREICLVLNFAIGFWFYSNQQIFYNKVIPKENIHDVINHGHNLIESITTINPGTPFLVFLVVHYLMKSKNLTSYYDSLKSRIFKTSDDTFIMCKVPFFQVVQEQDKLELQQREEKLRFILNIQAYNHSIMHSMFSNKEVKQAQETLINYNIAEVFLNQMNRKSKSNSSQNDDKKQKLMQTAKRVRRQSEKLSKKTRQLKNYFNKKILNLAFYEILQIPFYRYLFEYHARLWYNFNKPIDSNSNSRSFKKKIKGSLARSKTTKDLHEGGELTVFEMKYNHQYKSQIDNHNHDHDHEHENENERDHDLKHDHLHKNFSKSSVTEQELRILQIIYMPYMTWQQVKDFDFCLDKTLIKDDNQLINQMVKQNIALQIGAIGSLGIKGNFRDYVNNKQMQGDTNQATQELGQQNLAQTGESQGVFDNFTELLQGN